MAWQPIVSCGALRYKFLPRPPHASARKRAIHHNWTRSGIREHDAGDDSAAAGLPPTTGLPTTPLAGHAPWATPTPFSSSG